jgi:hypothetical protein
VGKKVREKNVVSCVCIIHTSNNIFVMCITKTWAENYSHTGESGGMAFVVSSRTHTANAATVVVPLAATASAT